MAGVSHDRVSTVTAVRCRGSRGRINKPASVVQVACELQRDWAREETVETFAQILFGGERALAGAAQRA
jgi:hypothetical protein